MPLFLDPDHVRAALTALADRSWPKVFTTADDTDEHSYWAWSHKYRLGPPLPERDIRDFEDRWQVQLPPEYRHFVRHIGNGGAGPLSGLGKLGRWSGEPISTKVLSLLRQPFPLEDAWYGPFDLDEDELDEDEEERLMFSDHDDESYFAYDVTRGAMPIVDAGCGACVHLVVTGAPDQIWLDRRADHEGIEPVVDDDGDIITFGAWYRDWLNEALSLSER